MLTGTNMIASGTIMAVTAQGRGYTSAPTSATAGSGSATCLLSVIKWGGAAGQAVLYSDNYPYYNQMKLDVSNLTLDGNGPASSGGQGIYLHQGAYDVQIIGSSSNVVLDSFWFEADGDGTANAADILFNPDPGQYIENTTIPNRRSSEGSRLAGTSVTALKAAGAGNVDRITSKR
jgi:hypothetical protein